MRENLFMNNKRSQMSRLERLRWALLPKIQNREQFTQLLKQAKERQLLETDAFEMIDGVLQVSQTQVREAMIPRSQMVTIQGDLTPAEAIPQIIKAGHSRFPVTGKQDKVIGILLAKDLLRFSLHRETEEMRIDTIIRPPVFTPESKRLNILLREFRLNRNHMAIVVDEYGEVCGLITIEDVLEEIVGDIADEYDIMADDWIKKISDNEYSVEALAPIQEFNRYFQSNVSDADVDTIGGAILQKLTHFPKRGESVKLAGFTLTVIEASRRGIHLLRVTKNKTMPPTEETKDPT